MLRAARSGASPAQYRVRLWGGAAPPRPALRRRRTTATTMARAPDAAHSLAQGLVAAVLQAPPPLVVAALGTYWVASAVVYIHRRPRVPAREVLRRHFEWEPGFRYFPLAFVGWLIFLLVYPMLELLVWPFGCRWMYFYYPKANGAGCILERERVQHLRLDWHRFRVRRKAPVGRHPAETVQINLPHLDLPSRGVQHWPYRQLAKLLHPEPRRGSGRRKRGEGLIDNDSGSGSGRSNASVSSSFSSPTSGQSSGRAHSAGES